MYVKFKEIFFTNQYSNLIFFFLEYADNSIILELSVHSSQHILFFFYRLKFHQVLTSSFVRFLRCLSWRSLKLFHFQLEKFERLDRQGILNFEFVKLFKLHCPVASLNLRTSKFALRPVSVFFSRDALSTISKKKFDSKNR